MDDTDSFDCLKSGLCRPLPRGLASRLRSGIDVCGPRQRGRATVTAARVQPVTDPDAACDTSPAGDRPKPFHRPQDGQPPTFHIKANDALDSAERSGTRVSQDRTFRVPAVFSDSGAAF